MKITDEQVKKFYRSTRWIKFRAQTLRTECKSRKYRGHLYVCCDKCHAWFVDSKIELHHKVPIRQEWDRRLDVTNVRPLCGRCHFTFTKREHEKTRSGVFVVYGPPNSGKTTFVQENMMRNELVWDLDKVGEVMGFPKFPRPTSVASLLLGFRDVLVRRIREGYFSDRYVWIIISDGGEAKKIAAQIKGELINMGDSEGKLSLKGGQDG